jgi:hypothetical protein
MTIKNVTLKINNAGFTCSFLIFNVTFLVSILLFNFTF